MGRICTLKIGIGEREREREREREMGDVKQREARRPVMDRK